MISVPRANLKLLRNSFHSPLSKVEPWNIVTKIKPFDAFISSEARKETFSLHSLYHQ